MSYYPSAWKTGDVITAEKLNNMEKGISDADKTMLGQMVIDISGGSSTTLLPLVVDTNLVYTDFICKSIDLMYTNADISPESGTYSESIVYMITAAAADPNDSDKVVLISDFGRKFEYSRSTGEITYIGSTEPSGLFTIPD